MSCAGGEADVERIFAEATSALIRPDATPSDDLGQSRAGLASHAEKSRAVRVRIAIGAQRECRRPGRVRGTMSIRSTPRVFASCDVSQSSSFVIRPEAMIAISQPWKCFNCAAACVIAVVPIRLAIEFVA